MKKISVFLIICLIFLLTDFPCFAEGLKKPQGRIGSGYKLEKYDPRIKSNISANDLARIEQIIKQEELEKKRAKKELAEKMALDKERAEQEAKQAIKAEKDRLKQEKILAIERQKQREEEIKREVKRIREQNILKAQQEEEQAQQELQAKKDKELQDKLAEKERIEQEKLAERERIQQEKIAAKERQLEEKRLAKLRKEEEKLAKNPHQTEKKSLKAKFFKGIAHVKTDESSDANKETEIKNAEVVKNDNVSNVKIVRDPLTHKIVKEISNELSVSRPEMLEELSTLWVSAVQKSDTVYFAIMKLSNPNGEEVNKKGIKKILEPIIGAAPLIGQAFVNPAFTAGSVIGSNFMGAMMNDSATSRLAKVNDADLVILARAIDELQEALLLNYMAYKSALAEYELAVKITQERKKTYDKLNKENSSHVLLANTFYTEALDNQYKARQEFIMKRVVLEQMVGADALNEIEQRKVQQEKEQQQAKTEAKPADKTNAKTDAKPTANNNNAKPTK